MSKVKSEIEEFLKKTKGLAGSKSATDEFLAIIKRENIRQIKDQLASEFAPMLVFLKSIERQNDIIIDLLKRKLDLDPLEKEIMYLLKAKLKES